MSKINSFSLAATYELEIGAPFSPPQAIDPRVDEIWVEEKKRIGTHLTDGKIFSLSEHDTDHLLIHSSEYRYVLARRRAPDLANAGLNIQPIGVTGILLCADGLVLGRRSKLVSADTGLWESAPAGGLSRPDPKGQIMEELEEELGLGANDVAPPEVCGLIENVETGVFDIVFKMFTHLTDDDVKRKYRTHGSNEYSELAVIQPERISAFLDERQNQLLPALRPMLGLAGLS